MRKREIDYFLPFRTHPELKTPKGIFEYFLEHVVSEQVQNDENSGCLETSLPNFSFSLLFVIFPGYMAR